MKKTRPLMLALLCSSSLAMAGTPIYVTEYIAPNPTPSSAPAEPLWQMEAAAYYGFTSSKLFKSSAPADVGYVDMYGGDFTLIRDLENTDDSFNIRFGYGYGSNKKSNGYRQIFEIGPGEEFVQYYDERVKLHRFYLMPGYRWTQQIGQSWTGYLGVNLGVDNSSIKLKTVGEFDQSKSHNSAWGFAYSAELGVQYHWTPCLYSFLAYQFQGSTSSPSLDIMGERASTKDQMYHCVRMGLGWTF